MYRYVFSHLKLTRDNIKKTGNHLCDNTVKLCLYLNTTVHPKKYT